MSLHNTASFQNEKIFLNVHNEIIVNNISYRIITTTIKVALNILQGLITLPSGRKCEYDKEYFYDDTQSFVWEKNVSLRNLPMSSINLNEIVIYKELSASNPSTVVLLTRNDKIFILKILYKRRELENVVFLTNVANIILIKSERRFPIYLDDLRNKLVQDYINNICDEVNTQAKLTKIYQIGIFVLIINLLFFIYLFFVILRSSKISNISFPSKFSLISNCCKDKLLKERKHESYYSYIDVNKI